MAEPKNEAGKEKFVERREPGKILRDFVWEEVGQTRRGNIRYVKMDDLDGIVAVDIARRKERAELEMGAGLPKEITDAIQSEIGNVPEVTEEVVEKIKADYKIILLEYQNSESDNFVNAQNDLEKALTNSNAPFFLVVTDENKVVGYIETGGCPGRDPEAIWIHTISMLPEYQGKKIGEDKNHKKTGFAHELLQLAIEEARKEEGLKERNKIALSTHTWTPRAVKFWWNEGFKPEKFTPAEEAEMAKAGWRDLFSIKMVRHIDKGIDTETIIE